MNQVIKPVSNLVS